MRFHVRDSFFFRQLNANKQSNDNNNARSNKKHWAIRVSNVMCVYAFVWMRARDRIVAYKQNNGHLQR